MKKILAALCLLFCVFAPLGSVFLSVPVSAASGSDTTDNVSVGFLGLRPWYYGLTEADGDLTCVIANAEGDNGGTECMPLSEFIWTAVLNVVSDGMIIASVIVTGYIIYAGYQYITSTGDPGKMTKAKGTITSATIGAIIVLAANLLVNTMSAIIFANVENGANEEEVTVEVAGGAKVVVTLPQAQATEVVQGMFNGALALSGLVAVIFIIYGGVSYMTASGDSGKIAKGKATLKAAIIGLFIVILSAVISNFIFSAILQSMGAAA